MKKMIFALAAFCLSVSAVASPKQIYAENFKLVEMAIALADSPVEMRPVSLQRALKEKDRDLAGAYMAGAVRLKGLAGITPLLEKRLLEDPAYQSKLAALIRQSLREKEYGTEALLFR